MKIPVSVVKIDMYKYSKKIGQCCWLFDCSLHDLLTRHRKN